MALIPETTLPSVPVRYPSFTIDSTWNTQSTYTLKRTQGVVEYDITVSEGTLSGGTTPAWNVSKTVPILSHLRLDADNTTIHDYDCVMGNEYEFLSRGAQNAGLTFIMTMCDVDYTNANLMHVGLFPSFAFAQNTLFYTQPTLASITTGSPTSSSGTNMYITEIAVPRSLINFKPLLVKKLQFSQQTLSTNGDNIFTNLLPQTGAYKTCLFFISTGANYTSGSNSYCDYISLKLNDTVTDTDLWFTAGQNQNYATFQGRVPDTGFMARVWMANNDTSKLLALGDTRAITGIALDIHTTQATTYCVGLKVIYA